MGESISIGDIYKGFDYGKIYDIIKTYTEIESKNSKTLAYEVKKCLPEKMYFLFYYYFALT